VKRLEGKPFALIGVNSDRDREKTQKLIAKEKITWRSFWNGGGIAGPISTAWNVQIWPTLYLVDAQGVIRHKYLKSPGVEVLYEAIEALLKDSPASLDK
jgi:hypothetical protein